MAVDLSGLSTPEQAVIARATSTDPANRFPSCVAFVKALTDACPRIPPEEQSVIEGVARLNASGLIAGEHAAADGSKCFGPFHTSPVGSHAEDLALSDGEEDMASFAHRARLQPEPARKDETDTIDFRLPQLPPAVPAEFIDPEAHDPWRPRPLRPPVGMDQIGRYLHEQCGEIQNVLPRSGLRVSFSPDSSGINSRRGTSAGAVQQQFALLAALGIWLAGDQLVQRCRRTNADRNPASTERNRRRVVEPGRVRLKPHWLCKEGKYAERWQARSFAGGTSCRSSWSSLPGGAGDRMQSAGSGPRDSVLALKAPSKMPRSTLAGPASFSRRATMRRPGMSASRF